MRLPDLKATAQEAYADPLDWRDFPQFGGSAWADVGKNTVSVMVEPPEGNPHICIIRNGRQEPLIAALVQMALL